MNNKFISFLNKKKTKQVGEEEDKEIMHHTAVAVETDIKKDKAVTNTDQETNGDLKKFLSSLSSSNKESSVTQLNPNLNGKENSKSINNIENEQEREKEEIKAMAKQYYQYLNKKGIDKEMPFLMKKQLNIKVKEETRTPPPLVNKEIKIEKEEYAYYQMKKFPLDASKEKISDFLTAILSNNLIKVKRLKDENNEFNGIIQIKVNNNEKAINDLLVKKHYYEKNKLKLTKITP